MVHASIFLQKNPSTGDGENSSKMPLNSHASLFADKMPGLIDQWRSEISKTKNYRPRIAPQELKSYLKKCETHGVPTTLVALAVLSCEWVFRVRRPTEDDIEEELLSMEKNLSKGMNNALSHFQAHLLVKILKSDLKKELRNRRIPIVLGFGNRGPHPDWFSPPVERKRTTPKRVVPSKRGRPPILGPILAGVVVGEILADKIGRDGLIMGQELCEILFQRKVLPHEYQGWRKVTNRLSESGDGVRSIFCAWLQSAHKQVFERPGDKKTPDQFLELCETEPKSVLWRATPAGLLEKVYSAKWSDSKTQKRRRT